MIDERVVVVGAGCQHDGVAAFLLHLGENLASRGDELVFELGLRCTCLFERPVCDIGGNPKRFIQVRAQLSAHVAVAVPVE